MFALRRHFDLLFFITLVASLSVLMIIRQNRPPQFHMVTSFPTSQSSQITPSPTITQQVETTSWNSSDGTMQLIMQVRHKNTTKLYTFSVADATGQNPRVIFTKSLPANSQMVIPFNSWSPDNTYIYLQQKDTNDFLVFKASGEIFANGQPYIDVPILFSQHNSIYTFGEATGWASPTLLIVNTRVNAQTQGPSYWFEVPSQTFIQLSTQF